MPPIYSEQSQAAQFCSGQGCSLCHHTGYRGRKGIFEMMTMTATIREMTFKGEPTQQIRRQAHDGHANIAGRWSQQSLKGITTLDEVL